MFCQKCRTENMFCFASIYSQILIKVVGIPRSNFKSY